MQFAHVEHSKSKVMGGDLILKNKDGQNWATDLPFDKSPIRFPRIPELLGTYR